MYWGRLPPYLSCSVKGLFPVLKTIRSAFRTTGMNSWLRQFAQLAKNACQTHRQIRRQSVYNNESVDDDRHFE